MQMRLPTGNDIAELLLLCAPPAILAELELSNETATRFAEDFDVVTKNPTARNFSYCVNLTSLALYYCTKNAVNYRKSLSITSCLYFTVPAIYELTQTVDIEAFDWTDKLKDEIQKGIDSSKGKNAGKGKHEKITRPIKERVLEYYRNNVDPGLSAPDARKIVVDGFIKPNYVTLSDRKMEDYIREEKKKKRER